VHHRTSEAVLPYPFSPRWSQGAGVPPNIGAPAVSKLKMGVPVEIHVLASEAHRAEEILDSLEESPNDTD
jgi:hypothetical protein